MKAAANEFTPTLRKWLSASALRSFGEFIADRRRNFWTPDARGLFHSEKISADGLEHIMRGHRLFRVRQLELSDFDAESCFQSIERLSQKRGRISPFDEKSLKLIIMLLRFVGTSIDDHKKLLKSISRRATNRSKPIIKQRAVEFRSKIVTYCLEDKTTKGQKTYEESRDKAMMLLLLTCSPLRVNTLSLLPRASCGGRIITVAESEMKTRESITFLMPVQTAVVMDRYLEMTAPSTKWLFSTKSGNAMSRNAIYKTVRRRCEMVLGVKLGTHSFRAIMATIVSSQIGQEFASSLLVIDISTLRNHYDLSVASDKLTAAIKKVSEELK